MAQNVVLGADREGMGLSSVASSQVIQEAQKQSNERLDVLIAEQRHTNVLLTELLRLVTANSVEPAAG